MAAVKTQLASAFLVTLSCLLLVDVARADYADEVLADNPIGYWRLTETDPNAPAGDETTNNRPMTFNNFTEDLLTQPGPFIDETFFAPSFVTAQQTTISAEDPADFAFTAGQSFSYDFWIRTSDRASPNQVGVVTKGYTTTSQQLPWYLSRVEHADGATEFFTRNQASASQQANGEINISDEVWHHVAAVYDATAGENRIYVDGVLDAVKTEVPEDDYGTNGEPLTLGTHFSRFFTGQMAEMAIYDSALSEERVQAHFDAGLTTPELRGDFDFDGAVTLADYDILADNFVTGKFYAQGDFNQDVKVDLADFAGFLDAFGGAAAVPEPSTMLLSVAAALGFALLARKR